MATKKRFSCAALLVGALTLCGGAAHAYDDVFERVGERYGVDPLLLKAIASKESGLNPYALNINHESIQCESAEEAYAGLLYVLQRPWVLHLPKGGAKRLLGLKARPNCVLTGPTHDRAWFSSESNARAFASKNGLAAQPIRRNVASTDIGLMQINVDAHGERIQDLRRLLFDTEFNVSYAAYFLTELASEYGPYKAIAYYHYGRESVSSSYRADVLEIYHQLLSEEVGTEPNPSAPGHSQQVVASN